MRIFDSTLQFPTGAENALICQSQQRDGGNDEDSCPCKQLCAMAGWAGWANTIARDDGRFTFWSEGLGRSALGGLGTGEQTQLHNPIKYA